MTRLRDGTRKVTQITEIRGLDVEHNIITEDIYIFDMGMGWDEDGKHRGRLKATGSVPRFAEKFKELGIGLPDDTFKAEQITRRIQAQRSYAEEVVEGDISSERARRALTAGNIGSYTKFVPTRFLLEQSLQQYVNNQVGGRGVDNLLSWADHRLFDFLFAYNTEPDAVEAWLIEVSLALGEPGKMLISHGRARCAATVARLLGAQQVLEVGTFTGYSTMQIARALEGNGKIVTLDISEEWTTTAREAWEKFGVSDRIELKLGTAIDTIKAMPDQPTLDMVFLDADAEMYIDYHEAVLPRLKPGGVILVDDAIMEGRVLVSRDDPDADAMRAYATHALTDERVRGALLPVAEGMLMLRKL
jgi:caffeoyl-CoA O-methyltransferase